MTGWGRLLTLAGLGLVMAAACSSGRSLPGRLADNGSGGTAGTTGAPCTDGQIQDCHVTLGEHNGVLSCYSGTQTCQSGTWSACGNGSVSSRAAPATTGTARSAQSLSSPTPCQNNPCDPSCQGFNEQPEAGVTSDSGVPKYNWSGGTLTGYPIGLTNMGLKQPCSQGSDCQLNEYCQDPVTGAACTHSKCQTGGGLDPSCDACVGDICAADPSCCNVPYVTSCTHDPCSTGPKLQSSCDPCVSSICAQDPGCCGASWGPNCVSDVNSVCGKSCPLIQQGTWSQSCVDQVATVCDAKCGQAQPGTCSHNPCTQGGALSGSCDSCVNSICAQDPSCCSTAWDGTCVAAVSSICGESCPITTSIAPPEDGTCTPWLPGQTDSSCSGIDLSAGIPCSNAIPVCNHGTQTAPAGIPIITYPANSDQYPKCDPAPQPDTATCKTTQPIPPGRCIDVTGCIRPIDNEREIMVNPPDSAGTTGHVAECSCQDNWTLYSKGTSCSPPSCSNANTQPVGSCTYSLPSPGSFDPTAATVIYTSGSGTTTTLPQLQNASDCGGGWYYDNNTTPTQITLCPSTCSTAQADAGATISIQVGCPKVYGPVTYTQTYQATCPTGTAPQWGYLAYDTTTPADSSIQFAVRTAPDATSLSSASFVSAATAQASPDTQVCAMSGPAPCPVDLYPKLGQFDAVNPYLELQITLTPTSDGSQSPTVNNWQLAYSCPPAQ